MRSMLSTGGTAGPMLVSVLKPYAPPQPPWLHFCSSGGSFGVSVQYAGATYSYGPVIFTPLAPVIGVGLAVADDTTGFGHKRFFSTVKYICSTSGGGGLSLPFSHITKLGWLRIRYICEIS